MIEFICPAHLADEATELGRQSRLMREGDPSAWSARRWRQRYMRFRDNAITARQDFEDFEGAEEDSPTADLMPQVVR